MTRRNRTGWHGVRPLPPLKIRAHDRDRGSIVLSSSTVVFRAYTCPGASRVCGYTKYKHFIILSTLQCPIYVYENHGVQCIILYTKISHDVPSLRSVQIKYYTVRIIYNDCRHIIIIILYWRFDGGRRWRQARHPSVYANDGFGLTSVSNNNNITWARRTTPEFTI